MSPNAPYWRSWRRRSLVLAPRAAVFGCFPQHKLEPAHVDGLLKIVEGAFVFDRADCGVDGSLAGQQHHRDLGLFGSEMSQELETVEVRHHNVGDHNMGSKALDAVDGLAAVAGRLGEIAPAGHDFAETLPRGFFIIHYEHTLVGHIESLAQRSNMKRI